MASPTKSERIELRVTAEQKSEIEQAAALSGRSVTDFSVTVLPISRFGGPERLPK